MVRTRGLTRKRPGTTARPAPRAANAARDAKRPTDSGIGPELTAERIRRLHKRQTRNDFGDLPEVLGVLHLLRRLAADNDDRPDQLVIGGAPIDFADDGVDLAASLVRLDHVGR